jgi:peroxiredoxin
MRALLVVLVSLTLNLAASAQVETGKPAPDFTLKDTTGKSHTLSAYKGKIVVLEWQNEECPFVKRHYGGTDTMIKLANANPDVVWLAIDSSTHRTPDKIAKFAAQEKIPYPILSDPNGTVGRLYGAKTTPHMFIIAADGTIVYQGAIDDDPTDEKPQDRNYVADAIRQLKAGQKVEVTETKPYGCSVKYK